MPPRIDINSYLPGLRAVIETRWERGYAKRVIPQVEGFYVDSSLDNDADSWQVQLGDPTGDYLAMMNRDNEVRVELLSADPGGAGHIMTGITDDLIYDQDGMFTLSGRDYASLALDSMVEPQKWKKVKPMYVINSQAKKLGFRSTSLNNISKVKKIIKTDGSETFWEFWYRLVRNDQAYLWCGPNGALIMNKLNYSFHPTYYFGTPQKTDPARIADAHIPVEGIEIRKSTQGRVYKVWSYVHTGRLIWTGSVSDPAINDWIRRPTRIMQDTRSHTVKMAQKKAQEEIFEGKVGAVEIRLIISDPKFMININRMCRLRIPEIDLFGLYFIVGVKVQAGRDGFIQEIRLREKEFALTKRIPEQPRIPTLTKKPAVTGEPGDDLTGAAHQAVVNLIPGKGEWGDYYWRAAAEHQGEWDFDMFLAWLIAISQHETGWNNYREHGCNIGKDYVEWFPWNDPKTVGEAAGQAILHGGIGNRAEYERSFANQIGTHGLSFPGRVSNPDVGVGPFQLTSRNLKVNADNWYDKEHPNSKMGHNEFEGGRWDPEANIMEGARYFKECLDDTHMHNDGVQSQMRAMEFAYSKYHYGKGGGFRGDPDAIEVGKHAAKFLDTTRAAVDAVKQAEIQDQGTEAGDPSTASDLFPLGWPNNDQIVAAFRDNEWWGKIPEKPLGPIPEGPLNIQFLQANMYHEFRKGPILWIVIHTMEDNVYEDPPGSKHYVMGAENPKAAHNVAQGFSTRTDYASAHYCVDPNEIWQCVKDSGMAFGTPGVASSVPGGFSTNDYGLQIEHGGSAMQNAAQWADNYSQNMLLLSARLTKRLATKYGIQIKHLSKEELQAGVSGFAGHVDILAAFDSPDHYDPGPNFPWDDYIQMVKDAD